MADHLTVDDSYVCPHCQALLEIPDKPWRGWVLCPDCRSPGLPPEQLSSRRSSRRSAAIEPRTPQDQAPEDSRSSQERALKAKALMARTGQSNAWSSSRLIVSTGLFVSAFLLLVAYLDHSSHNLVIFGGLTAIFFVLLLRSSRQR